MTHQSSIAAKRARLLNGLFPEGVPQLWCPLLTHYDSDGRIDAPRIAAHLRHLSPHVKGYLIPGSTGDGWELTEAETNQLLNIALDEARKLDLHLLIGVLKADTREALKTIRDTVDLIESRTNEGDPEKALVKAHVSAFTVCPPRGRELSQKQIEHALIQVLEMNLPTAIYQLPQVTQNEISPELASSLAARFANFILFKDTSGTDRVALSGRSLEGVFTVRGAEGDYARWLNTSGGPYHGFLLSSANGFARELHQMIEDIPAKRLNEAQQTAERVGSVVNGVFKLVAGLADGNPFANANKAIDHFFAFGPRAADAPPARLHAGPRLPLEVIRTTGNILARHDLMPARGYLD